jgi:tetratricopeptide (TPR) repeat protein
MATAPSITLAPAAPKTSRRREILERYVALDGQTDRQVLGVGAGADGRTVREAYKRLVRRVHPDSLDPDSRDLTAQSQAILVRATEAYRALAGDRPEPAVAPRPAPAAAPRPPVEELLVPPPAPAGPSVEDVVAEAQRRLGESDVSGAVGLLHGVLARCGDEDGRRVRLLLARGYAREPRWHRYAVAQLRSLIEERPGDAGALALLGTVYRHEGLLARAESMLRRALAADPGQSEARSALRAVRAERAEARGVPSAPTPPPTLWKRIFRRKA